MKIKKYNKNDLTRLMHEGGVESLSFKAGVTHEIRTKKIKKLLGGGMFLFLLFFSGVQYYSSDSSLAVLSPTMTANYIKSIIPETSEFESEFNQPGLGGSGFSDVFQYNVNSSKPIALPEMDSISEDELMLCLSL